MDAIRNVAAPDLLTAAPRAEVQLVAASVHAVFWAFIIRVVFPPLVKRSIRGMQTKTRFLTYARQTFKKMIFFDIGENEEDQIEFIAFFEGVIVQHGISGLLCLPSAMGYGHLLPVGVASAMARHGGLCEVGWEFQDTVGRLVEICFGGEVGRAKNPPSILMAMAMHHTCAMLLVLPLNIYYPDERYYHEGIALLQFAAFVSFAVQQYGWTLDVKSYRGLRDMKVAVTLSWVSVMWSRVLRYGFVWYVLLGRLAEDGNTTLFRVALVPLICMSTFNLGIVAESTTKFMKFQKMQIVKPHGPLARSSSGGLVAASASARQCATNRRWAQARSAVFAGEVTRTA